MNTPNPHAVAVPVVTGPLAGAVADDEATKAAVRREYGSLGDAGLPGPVYTRAQARAERNLHAAIRAAYDEGVTVPCLTDPATWDADFSEGQVTREDVFRAANLCRTACPVFVLCEAYRLTNPPAHGILAGRYVRHPSEIRAPRPDRPDRADINRRDDWATGRDLTTDAAAAMADLTADAA
jgi:hypothetical protein